MSLAAAYILGSAPRQAATIHERDPRADDCGPDRLSATVEDEIRQLGEVSMRFTPELELLYDADRLARRRRQVRVLAGAAVAITAAIMTLHLCQQRGVPGLFDMVHLPILTLFLAMAYRVSKRTGSTGAIDWTAASFFVFGVAVASLAPLMVSTGQKAAVELTRPLELLIIFSAGALLRLPQRIAGISFGVGLGVAAFAFIADRTNSVPNLPILFGLSVVTLVAFVANRMMERSERESFLMRMRADLQLRRSEADRAAMERLAWLDPLTGVANRRAFDAEMALASMEGETSPPVLLALVDVDHFKAYNDVVGHLAGDECLRRVAAALRSRIGDGFLARYGGEEFAVLLRGRDAGELEERAEHLREAVLVLGSPHPGRSDGTACITASIGAAHREPGESGRSLIDRADRALYRAKAGGRNQVAIDGDATTRAVACLVRLRNEADANEGSNLVTTRKRRQR